jgi:hypothetical protein
MLVILNSGQTGVERGVHRAARHLGLLVAGFMSMDGHDELGRVPDDVAASLLRTIERGPRRAQAANIKIASGVVIVVPDARHHRAVTGMANIMAAARSWGIPSLVCDGEHLDSVVDWLRDVPMSSGSKRIYITGPRWTRWGDGERVGRHLVASIVAASSDLVIT